MGMVEPGRWAAGSVRVAAKFIATLDPALRRRGQQSDDRAQYRQVEQHLQGHQQLHPVHSIDVS